MRQLLISLLLTFGVSFSATADAETNSVNSGIAPAVAVDVADAATDATAAEPQPSENPATAPVEEAAPHRALPPVPDYAEEPHGGKDTNAEEKEDGKATIPVCCRAKCPIPIWIMATVAFIALIGKILAICYKKDISNNIIRCMELIVLFAILGLILWGTYDLLNRLIENLNEFNKQFAFQENVGKGHAIQKAYAQLSSELQRWMALLGVFGTFFGLVLPIGGYLLQIKAVDRKEEDVDKRIKEKIAAVEKKITGTINKIWTQQISIYKWLAMQQKEVVLGNIDYQNLVQNPKYHSDAIRLFALLSIIIGCACVLLSEHEARQTVDFVLDICDGLKKRMPNDDVRKQVLEYFSKANKSVNIRIYVDSEKLGTSYCEKIETLAKEVGMRIVYFPKGEKGQI